MIRIPHSLLLKTKSHLKKGGIIAYPTESCFGLGCNPKNINAVRKIIQLKKRKYDKGLIIIAYNLSQVSSMIDKINPEDNKYLEKNWPDAKTFLIRCKKKNRVHPFIRGKSNKIAIRIPKYEIPRKLCYFLKMPLISTSANISKQNVCKCTKDIRQKFKNILVLPGPIGKEISQSKIIDLETKKQYR